MTKWVVSTYLYKAKIYERRKQMIFGYHWTELLHKIEFGESIVTFILTSKVLKFSAVQGYPTGYV